MSAEPVNKPAPAQVDFSERPHQPQKDDVELNAAGQALLAYIEETARPKELAAAYPRIVNHMAKLWKRSEEHTSELQSLTNLVCRLLLEKKQRQRQQVNSSAMSP